MTGEQLMPGRHGVHIASLNLGRRKSGGSAVAVLNLDPPSAVQATILEHPQIESVTVVKLPPAGAMPVWSGVGGREKGTRFVEDILS